MADSDEYTPESTDDWPGKPMRYFGPGKTPDLEQVPTPESTCSWCEEGFDENDHGFVMDYHSENGIVDSPWHRECLMRSILGSVAHQREECNCHGGENEDDPNLTKREAAKAALAEMERKQ